jgi:hypothetical protein
MSVTDDDGESKSPPIFKVVSGNPNARADREIERAMERVRSRLADLAASMLRMMAGGESASFELMRKLRELIDAQQDLRKVSGEWLSVDDQHRALTLPQSELKSDFTDHQYREWQQNRGMERIVQGALRLAAHQVLGERPHFGGKYSERLIEEGIASIERAFKPPPSPKSSTKNEKGVQRVFGQRLRKGPRPTKRKKPWSSLDSRSYRDPKPEGE